LASNVSLGLQDFLGLESVMPVGLANVNIEPLAQYLQSLGEHCALKKWLSGLDTMNNPAFQAAIVPCGKRKRDKRQAFLSFPDSPGSELTKTRISI
jgi:hypothetical protein